MCVGFVASDAFTCVCMLGGYQALLASVLLTQTSVVLLLCAAMSASLQGACALRVVIKHEEVALSTSLPVVQALRAVTSNLDVALQTIQLGAAMSASLQAVRALSVVVEHDVALSTSFPVVHALRAVTSKLDVALLSAKARRDYCDFDDLVQEEPVHERNVRRRIDEGSADESTRLGSDDDGLSSDDMSVTSSTESAREPSDDDSIEFTQ